MNKSCCSYNPPSVDPLSSSSSFYSSSTCSFSVSFCCFKSPTIPSLLVPPSPILTFLLLQFFFLYLLLSRFLQIPSSSRHGYASLFFLSLFSLYVCLYVSACLSVCMSLSSSSQKSLLKIILYTCICLCLFS